MPFAQSAAIICLGEMTDVGEDLRIFPDLPRGLLIFCLSCRAGNQRQGITEYTEYTEKERGWGQAPVIAGFEDRGRTL